MKRNERDAIDRAQSTEYDVRTATETLHKKLFTVDEFMRMSEAGVFPPEGRFELIPGFSLAVDEILGPATDQD